MIALDPARSRLTPLERYGLMVLVDQSGLLPVEGSLDRVITLALGGRPIALGQAAAFAVESGKLLMARETLAQVAAVAGVVAEQESLAEDRHQRVPSEVNAMVAAGLTQAPWISTLARGLRDAVVAHAHRYPVRTIAPWPAGHRWAAAFTHDLDVVSLWPLFTGLRLVELAKKGKLGQAIQVGGSAIPGFLGDPVTAGVREVLAIEREHSVTSTWFIIAGNPSFHSTMKGDVTYSVESRRARGILSAIVAGGHELGLHGSFATFQDASAMAAERERLRAATGATVTGIRQHFLRMRPGATQRAMVEAGFAYDSSFGFPDRNGFRLGVANVVPLLDHRSARVTDLEEAPLTWMDRALSKYRGIEIAAEWVDEGIALAKTAEAEEGLWVGLWHPNLTRPLGFPGAPAEFRRLVQSIVVRNPYLAPLATLVEWRKARRSLVAKAISPDGVPVLGAAGPGSWPVVLEDGRGRPLEHFTWPAAA